MPRPSRCVLLEQASARWYRGGPHREPETVAHLMPAVSRQSAYARLTARRGSGILRLPADDLFVLLRACRGWQMAILFPDPVPADPATWPDRERLHTAAFSLATEWPRSAERP